ncbi:MAG: hypothetical protein ONB05_07815 [candidate division KSB1 bacterium]|nr:hypothetical protein [candidate division KSB1 bacterium]
MEQQPSKLVPALIGGAFIGIVSSVPVLNFVNCFCCAGVIAGGVLAVYMYNRNLSQEITLTNSDGVLLGLLAGVFGAIIGGILQTLLNTNLQHALERIMEYSENMPPETEELLRRLEELEFGPAFFMIMLMIGLVIDAIFGIIGGLIGVAIFKKKKI